MTAAEVFRRIYHEIIRGRTSVRVVPPAPAKLSCVPIFVTGPFRSGTTLVRNILDSHSHICCPPESNFLRAFDRMLSDVSNRKGLESMGFDEDHVTIKLREWAAYFFESYAQSVGKPRWADKTPAYTMYLDFLDRLFPEAQYIMIYRHPLDVANSATHKGAVLPDYAEPFARNDTDPRVAAAAYWNRAVSEMHTFEQAHPDRCYRLFYKPLCENPEQEIRHLLQFLQEPWEPAVLEHHRFEHDKGPEDARAAYSAGFGISERNYVDWPPEVIHRAAEAADPMRSQLGYDVEVSCHSHPLSASA